MHRIDVSHFQLYSKDNSKFTYYTSTGKFTIHAGQDGVTEDWIQQIKELHRIERNDIRREQQNSSIDAITSLVGDKSESLTSDSSPEEIYFRLAKAAASLTISLPITTLASSCSSTSLTSTGPLAAFVPLTAVT